MMKDTYRTECGMGRVSYHPEWDKVKPWVSYWEGTASQHFATPADAAAYFKVRRNAKLKTD